MEFWGVEVKPGQTLNVKVKEESVLHLSQACLGEVGDKAKDSALLSVRIAGQKEKLVIGTLLPGKFPQITFDLVFDKDFDLSHTWKSGSVYYIGYTSVVNDESSDEDFDFESDDEQILPVANGKPVSKAAPAKASESNKAAASKPGPAAAKSNVKVADPKKDAKPDEDDDSEDDDMDEDDVFDSGDDSDELVDEDSSDDDEDDESSDEEDDVTPKKVESSKKRPAESVTKTPAPEKKAKLVTPQKTGGDGKKAGGHTATPHPSKKTGKKDVSAEKSKPHTPKSGGQVSCKSCSKTFNSDTALQSHSKAKHSVGN